MPRKRNPRVIALTLAADIRRTASKIRSTWNVGTIVYDETGRAPARARRASEYPENRQEMWMLLHSMACEMEVKAASLRALATQGMDATAATGQEE